MSKHFWVCIDTTVIVAIITLVGTILQFIVAPYLDWRRKRETGNGQEDADN